MRTKEFQASIKAVGDGGLEDGQFKAVVSVFGNVDLYGDVVMEGAFSDSLADWKGRGDPIPIIWSHQWSDPFSFVGEVLEAKETSKGLEILGFISPEERQENKTAAKVYKLLKSRNVTQFSFGFDVEDAGMGTRGEGEKAVDVFELRKLKLHEVGPCLLGVNPDTELLAMKSRQLDGRNLAGNSKALETIHGVIWDLQHVLAEAKAEGEPGTGPGTDPAVTDGTQTNLGSGAEEDEGSQESAATSNEDSSSSASGGKSTPASLRTQTRLALDLQIAELDFAGKD